MNCIPRTLAYSVFAVLVVPAVRLAADNDVPTVYPTAILPFQERGEQTEGLGAKISDVLFVSLATSPDLYLVDRTNLGETLKEQKLSISGVVQPDRAVAVGRLTGAKLLITGSVIDLDRKLYLIAKIIGTETGRVIGVSVKGETSDDLSELAEQLGTEVVDAIQKQATVLVPKKAAEKDRVAALTEALGEAKRPSVWIHVEERHVGQQVIDPAAETELTLLCRKTKFQVIDAKEGSRKQADVIIEGEAFSEYATRTEDLVSVMARVEIKAVDRRTGKVIMTDRQTEIVVGLAEQIAGKSALQQAAGEIATRLLPAITKHSRQN